MRKTDQHGNKAAARYRVLILALLLALLWCPAAAGQSCGTGWCKTFPVGSVHPLIPPLGASAWNKLNYVPDAQRFFIYTSDEIYTFSNSWWSYEVLGHVATSNPWQEESTSGTVQRTVTDNSKGFLKTAISSTDTKLTVGEGQGATFHPDGTHGGVLVIDEEEIGYTAANRSGDTFTEVTRGIRGTRASSHRAGALVNAGAPFPQSRIDGKLVPAADHIPDRHPFLTSAYDSRRHQLFQASGIIELNKLRDTWYFCLAANQFCPAADVRTWRRLLTETSLPGKADSAMAYDSDDDVMILYGGQTTGSPTADTWLLCFQADPQVSGNSVGCPRNRKYPDWVQVAGEHGGAGLRYTHSVVYDAYHHVAVLFGGMDGGHSDPNSTWVYSPSKRTWSNAKPSGEIPDSFRRPAMTYDSRRHQIVLYEGPPGTVTNGVRGGLYLYDAGTNRWTLTKVDGGPVPSSPAGAAHGRLSLDYDPDTDTFVATEVGQGYSLQVWELKGEALGSGSSSPPAQHARQ